MFISVFTDGGARGNPGPAGFGLVILDSSKKVIYQDSCYLGIKTNNEAEYAGLISALNWIKSQQSSLHLEGINFFSDSELLIRQLNGQYRVKAVNLQPLYHQALALISQISPPITFKHTPREGNVLADQLANQAMDRRL